MHTLFVTVSDGYFFPGTVATVSSVRRFHPEARICVVDNHIDKRGLTAEQRLVFEAADVTVVEAAALAKPGRKLAAWELKAYAAADLSTDAEVLVGIDSDCVLCGPIHDVLTAAVGSGRFHGGKDGDVQYDASYAVYGIATPVRNHGYMSASLYVCALTAANREALEKWATHCDRALFGGGGIYPGHGDQGVLNAILFANRGPDAVSLLDNRLWSQHGCYWQEPLALRTGLLFNPAAAAPQRALHCGGTEKFWSKAHLEKLRSFETHTVNYAWFLALLWFGACRIEPEHLEAEHSHLVTGLARYRTEVMAFLDALRPPAS